MLYSNKRLQNTNRYKEYQSLNDNYYHLSLQKENNQKSFLNNLILTNNKTEETISINYNFDTYYKKYTKSIEQKVYTIEQIAKDKGLVPVFVTLTLPTYFHPFKSIKYKDKRLYTSLNGSFQFKNINEAISNGYDYLNIIYRTFYKRVKNKVSNLMYVKVVEQHKTLIPHFHILFYVKKSEIKIIRKNFDKINQEFSLTQSDLEVIKTNINRASKYLMKYITKSLNNNEDYYMARLIDGWKRQHKIRMITMSNLDLSLAEFRTIYYNISKEQKEKLLHEAKENKVNLFYYILKNIYKLNIIRKNNNTIIKQIGNINKAKLFLIQNITKLKKPKGGYLNKIDNLKFYINYQLIYDKPKYNIWRINNEYKINING